MNFTTIKTLETVQRKMQRMNTEEAAKFRLDNTLGGSSEFVARRAICRYKGGEALSWWWVFLVLFRGVISQGFR